MISKQNPVFKAHASPYLKPMVTDFKNQVMYIESNLIDFGLTPTSFNLGRDDTYQYFEFGVEETDEDLLMELKAKVKSLANTPYTSLVNNVVCYKCEICSRIHLCFYIKALSPKNPFRIADLQSYLKYFRDETTSLH